MNKKLLTYLSLFTLLLTASPYALARLSDEYTPRIDPFTTDGCSVSPEGTLKDKSAWLHCCLKHDLSYWQGGQKSEKLKADKALRSCIANTGHAAIARIYYYAVRAGGTPRFETSWRWGYGWPYKIGFSSLTSEQRQSVQEELQLAPQVIEDFIRNYHADIEQQNLQTIKTP